ncbi:hypothetical protein ACWC2T_30950 [Streptomyces sp. NPDC001393]
MTPWPANPAWKFVALGLGNDVPFWTEFLRALAEIDPDAAETKGLALAAKNLHSAAAAL